MAADDELSATPRLARGRLGTHRELVVEPLCGAKRTRRRARIGPSEMPRDRAFVAFARLHLFESVGQRADRTRQDEQPAAERRREAELREDHAGGAVDVHRHGSPFLRRKLRLHRSANGGKASAHRAGGSSDIHQLEQARGTRIPRMKAMPKTGNISYAVFCLKKKKKKR